MIGACAPIHPRVGQKRPAWTVFRREVTDFLADDALRVDGGGRPHPCDGAGLAELTAQEHAVLDLAARGLDNPAIADELCLSVRTVERHLQNTYRKLGVSGTAARTAAVAAVLTRR